MADRRTFHKKHLNDFKSWLENNGWKVEQTKGEYEVLRATINGRKPLIIYSRLDSKEHYSVLNNDMPVIKDFLKENKQ